MRICLLTDNYAGSDSPMREHDLPCDPRPYLPEAEWERVAVLKPTAVRQVIELSRRGFDLFFNLCDGAWDEDRPGIEVVQALERLGLAFTGATPEFYDPSREAMKRVCRAWGIDTPAYVLARGEEDVGRAADLLRFPMIVKHPASYSSIGLTRASRVESFADLAREVGRMLRAFGGALVEEFVEGRECTVLVAENPDDPRRPTTYVPIEYRFPPGESFKHFDLKWIEYEGLGAAPVRDPELEERLRDLSAKLFRGLHGAGYGRCDIRVDAEGRPFLLEINPNCGVFYPPSDPGGADLCLLHDPAGHAGFARQIVAAALRRRERTEPAWEVRSTREGDYGMFALRPIAEGERIVVFEEQPHVLVTRSHVERSWGEPERSWFARYAWPLTDEVWVMWGRDPMEWKPINHSCEPTAWLEGLDLVARRALRPGEEITMDYATLCNEVMPAFACACGAPGCRGTVRGEDYRGEAAARYGRHVSDYVWRKREEGAGGDQGVRRPHPGSEPAATRVHIDLSNRPGA